MSVLHLGIGEKEGFGAQEFRAFTNGIPIPKNMLNSGHPIQLFLNLNAVR